MSLRASVGAPAARDIAHAGVIGHEVARLDAEILEVQRVPPGDGQRRPLAAASGTAFSAPPRTL